MRYFLTLLLVALSVTVAQAGMSVRRVGVGVPVSCSLPDAFGSDPASCWNADYGGAAWGWSGSAVTRSASYNADFYRYKGGTIASAGQYAQVVLSNFTNTALDCGGVTLRGGASAGVARYLVCIRANSSRARVFYVNTSGVTTQLSYEATCGTWATGDTFKATVTGTQSSTAWTIYQNGSGTPSCTLTGQGVGTAGIGCDPTGSADPSCAGGACCVDSGSYVGIGVEGGDDNTDAWTFDDFTGGTVP